MTNKEMKKLSRAQLLEMLLLQTEKVEKLEKELEEAKEKLAERKVLLENVGSIAEASLQLNEVFKAAQNAADQYLENAILSYQDVDNLRMLTQLRCDKMLLETEKQCEEMKNECARKCKLLEQETVKQRRNNLKKSKVEMLMRRQN